MAGVSFHPLALNSCSISNGMIRTRDAVTPDLVITQ